MPALYFNNGKYFGLLPTILKNNKNLFAPEVSKLIFKQVCHPF